jgi:hypothetical protein
MTTIHTHGKVGPDGKLVIALDAADAGTEVAITISPVTNARRALTREEWEAFLDRTAGSIDDPTFERGSQGAFENRESLD